MKFCLFLVLIIFLKISNPLKSQILTDSNLPIVIITTDNGATIPDEPKIGATMQIIYRGEGERNYLTDTSTPAYLNYNGRIRIEVRGSTSAQQPQKPYGIETRLADNSTTNNVSLLGMPSENDWILLALFQDKSLIRNYLAYDLARNIDMYASRGKYCEVILNGDYQGLYILEEKIKRDKNRVDITELLVDDNSSLNISGGYILQEDDGGVITNPHANNTANNALIIEEPDFASSQKISYLQNFFNSLHTAATGSNSANFATGYPSFIDTYSFYNYFIINELFNNTDAYSRSTYYHKDRNGKLIFGPVWDFDLAGGNTKQTGGTTADHWELKTGFFRGPLFLNYIFDEPTFRCHMAKRWQEKRQANNILNTGIIMAKIDSLVTTLSEAKFRHFTKWPVLGFCQYLDPPGCDTRTTHEAEIDYLKQFLTAKASWIDANILSGYNPCSYPTLPNLVINEIMYNPFFVASNTSLGNISAKKQAINATADDYEFIEIKNNETISVDLTGLYFRGGGIVYQFPPNTNIAAGAIIVIASNALEFEARYGFAPFGQFTRDLSNTGESIILADAMANVIDAVNYSNQTPWPNAYGKSLELKTSNLDNTLAVNWFQQPVNGGSPGVENVYVAPDPCAILPKIMINEINYSSLTNVPPTITNTSDWVEIYNAESTPVDISGWLFKDATNTFVIPANTILAANDYLVICQNTANFLAAHPGFTKYINNSTGIGLSSGGEVVSITDANSCVVDELTYDELVPWPPSPNGQGFTLSLKSPSLDNSLGENWAASTAILGTPGAFNFENTALPVKIKDFFGENADTETKLFWLVTDENNINKYEIEWSENAKSFQKIGEIKAQNLEKYQFFHESDFNNLAYYRLKITENNGQFYYSNIIYVQNFFESKVEVFPIPTTDYINLKIPNLFLKSKITYHILDATGKIHLSKSYFPTNSYEKINLSQLPNGKYFIQIFQNNYLKVISIIIHK